MSGAGAFQIWQGGGYRIEHSRSVRVPGYLLVSPLSAPRSIARLDADGLAGLGPALALATALIEQVIAPERVYCARFGEEVPEVHFHLFPRTAWLLERYRSVGGKSAAAVHGPLLLDWAREAFGPETALSAPPPSVPQAVAAMQHLAGAAVDSG